MKKIANYLLIEKNEELYTISLTPELQDDLGTVGYVEFTDDTN
ncbi:TPA: glycine cleavage system protein H, partial [Streptococcus agalactiae]|nr:glycine cleavage system protein H [Streptococcus agalactiae]